MRKLVVETGLGEVAFRYEEGAFSRPPVAVLFHGFGRDAESLDPWRQRLPFEIIAARLPGHKAPEMTPSLDLWAEAFRQALSAFPTRPALVIGESLGAVIALSMGLPCVVIEPFLSTAKLWPVRASLKLGRARGLNHPDELVDGLFDDKDYSWVLPKITAPALVVGGDVPLGVPRSLMKAPSLLDDEDFETFSRHPLVETRRVAGNHLLMVENAEACLGAILDHSAKHELA